MTELHDDPAAAVAAPDPTGQAAAVERIIYPDSFRPIPGFSLDIPSSWLIGEAPGALFTFRTGERDDGAHAHVTVRHRRVDEEAGIVDVAQSTWKEILEEIPGLVLVDENFLKLRATHYVWEAEVPPTDSTDSITRFDSFTMAHQLSSPVRHVFHFTWSTPTAFQPEFKLEFAKILASFTFDD